MASEQLQRILEQIRSRPVAAPGATIQDMRAGLDQMGAAFPVADDVTRESTTIAGLPAAWFSAPGASPDRVILYLHGGGYVVGSITSHGDLVARLSRAAAARVLAIEYRLAPEHLFPAAIEDATAAYRALLAQGIDPTRIVIAGDSAGGGLTVATLLALRDAGDRLPAAGVCISPWVDLEGTGESYTTRAAADPMITKDAVGPMAKLYLGDADPRAPLASPIYAELRGLPPLLVQVGEAEVLYDDSTRLVERARAAGVDAQFEPWAEMFHVWHMYASVLPEGQQAIDRIGAYVRQRTPQPVSA